MVEMVQVGDLNVHVNFQLKWFHITSTRDMCTVSRDVPSGLTNIKGPNGSYFMLLDTPCEERLAAFQYASQQGLSFLHCTYVPF